MTAGIAGSMAETSWTGDGRRAIVDAHVHLFDHTANRHRQLERRDEMFEARRMIEVGVAALSATRATGEQIAAIAEEVTSMFASLDNPHDFLRHDPPVFLVTG